MGASSYGEFLETTPEIAQILIHLSNKEQRKCKNALDKHPHNDFACTSSFQCTAAAVVPVISSFQVYDYRPCIPPAVTLPSWAGCLLG